MPISDYVPPDTPTNNDYLTRIAGGVDPDATLDPRMTNNDLLRIIAGGTSGLAHLDSPALTGTPTAPTADAGDESEQIATTEFVQQEITANPAHLELMSPTTIGGAKLGDGLALTDGALGIDPEPQESTGAVRGAIASLTAKGWATQDGIPTPESPVPIQVAQGRNLASVDAAHMAKPSWYTGTWTGSSPYGDNGLTVTRTSTTGGAGGFRVDNMRAGTYIFSAKIVGGGTNYVMHVAVPTTDGTGASVVVNNQPMTISGSMARYTFTLSADASQVSIRPSAQAFASGSTAITFDQIQLELGSTPTPYVPYGHVGVEVQGRNLIDSSRYGTAANIAIDNYSNFTTFTISGVTFTRNSDGSLYASGTASAVTVIYLPLVYELPIGTQIALSGCPSGGSTSTFQVDPYYTDNTFEAGDVGSGFSKTITKPLNRVRIHIASGQSISKTFYPQLELGSTARHYQPYLNETIPVPLPSKGYAASLPDGTADVLTIDGAGKVEWASAVARIESYAGETVGAVYLSTTGELSTGAEVYYPLATPATEQCGYIDWPSIPDGAVITCPELDALGVRYLIGNGVAEMAKQWYERAKSEYEVRILALEEAVAELATT